MPKLQIHENRVFQLFEAKLANLSLYYTVLDPGLNHLFEHVPQVRDYSRLIRVRDVPYNNLSNGQGSGVCYYRIVLVRFYLIWPRLDICLILALYMPNRTLLSL